MIPRMMGALASVLGFASVLVACGSSSHGKGSGGATSASGATSSSASSSASSAASTGAGGGAGTGGSGGTGVTGRDFSSDRTKFFGASRCAAAGVQLCEDFESGQLDTSTWSVSGDTPVIDGMEHARGNKALHITKAGNGLSYIRETKTFPAVNNTYYGRAFFYFAQLPAAPGMSYAHWTFIAASGTGVSGEIRLSAQLQGGNNLFGVGTDSGSDPSGTGDWTNSDDDPSKNPAPVPLQKWVCVEWMHKGDTSETRFYWDATEHPSLYTSSTQHGGNSNAYLLPQFTDVWLGWQEYQGSSETFELWIDEIAIDKERIGCVL